MKKGFILLYLFTALFANSSCWFEKPDGTSDDPGSVPIPEIVVYEGANNVSDGSYTYDYGSIPYGTDAPEIEFTIKNMGMADLIIYNIAIDDTDNFSIDDDATKYTIAENQTTTFSIAFNPLSEGSFSAEVTISNNDMNEREFTFMLTGICTVLPEPEIIIKQGDTELVSGEGTYSFDFLVAGSSSATEFTIENNGTDDLDIESISINDDVNFKLPDPLGIKTVGAGESEVFTVVFTPVNAGDFNATVTVANNDTDEGIYTFDVSGTAVPPGEPEINVVECDVNPPDEDLPDGAGNYDFGSIIADGNGGIASEWVTFTIENTGTADLEITSVSLISGDTSDFDLTDNTSTPVGPSGSTTFTIRFDPLTTGFKSAIVSIENNDTDEDPYTFTITGIGENPWINANASGHWTERYHHTSVVFDNKIWVMGGYNGSYHNDVWYSSDGTNWTNANASGHWSARAAHTSVVFDNKIWVMGGDSVPTFHNDVWYSEDGTNWTNANASAPWSARTALSSVVFDNKIWVMGGYNDGTYLNDVWYSSDGINWTNANASGHWPVRSRLSSVVLDNKIWIMGGGNGSAFYNDVWYSSDGTNWTNANASGHWSIREAASTVVTGNKIWIMGGGDGSAFYNDVWYTSDGTNWTNANASSHWDIRAAHSSVILDNKIWVMGGTKGTGSYYNDVWYFTVAAP